MGTKSTFKTLRSGKAKLILIAGNCPPLRKSELEYYAMRTLQSLTPLNSRRPRPLTARSGQDPRPPLQWQQRMSPASHSIIPQRRSRSVALERKKSLGDGAWTGLRSGRGPGELRSSTKECTRGFQT